MSKSETNLKKRSAFRIYPPRRVRAVGGMTFIELLVGISIIVVVLVAFFGLFQASVRYVGSAKAREAAVSLATQRIEEMRALSYDAVGTESGIPPGAIAQNETVPLDGINFNRRTFIQYIDDPADGTGAADQNGIAADYKRAKVEVSWLSASGTSSVSMLSNFIPPGVESTAGGGTLSILAVDAQAMPIADAAVRIVNTSNNPAVDVTTYTNVSGQVFFPGTPAASSYQIYMSRPGYSSAETYASDAQNPNPNPGHLTVSAGQTTSATFAIDVLASLLVRSFQPIARATTTDSFADASNIAQSSQTQVAGGALMLSEDPELGYASAGSAYSSAIAPTYLSRWGTLMWNAAVPANTSYALRVYTGSPGNHTLLPDAVLPGNALGFTTSPIIFSGISTSTYPSLVLGGALSTSDASSTPSILDWALSYDRGPIPLPSIPFSIQGTKTIGTTGGGAPIYKVSEVLGTNSSSQYSTTTLEWDPYTLSVDPANGYDISSSCPFQPFSVSPGSSVIADLFLVSHTTHSLMLSVLDSVSGAGLKEAAVTLTRTGYAEEAFTDSCGNAFFSGLSPASDYIVTASAQSYAQNTLNNISVSGQSSASVSLNAI